MNSLHRVLDATSALLFRGACVAICLMTLHVFADITMKFFFNRPIQGTLEFVESYYMVSLIFLPLGFVTRSRQHITVDLFTGLMMGHGRAAIELFVAIFCALFAAALTWRGFDMAVDKTIIREVWRTPMFDLLIWPTRWFFPAGCLLMTIHFVLQAVVALQALFQREPVDPSVWDKPA